MTVDRLRPFLAARFGMFVHWGIYSVAGGRWRGKSAEYLGEWLQARFRIPNAEYARLADDFNPDGFDADDWVAKARDAGMRYLVFTAKHHDGFSMFRTRHSPFNVVDATPFARDPLAELASACRRRGIRLGIYYSHFLDWREKDAGHPARRATNADGASLANDWDFPDRSEKRFDRYFSEKALPQVEELLSEYGDVLLMWFDCPCDMEERHCRALRDLVRAKQPACLVNERIGHGYGDYRSLGDNRPMTGRARRPVEAIGTLNDSWGFKFDDHNWKRPREIIGRYLSLMEKRANYLLNVGPRPDGAFPRETDDVLAALAEWRRGDGAALREAEGSPFPQELDFAYCLAAGRKLHFFLNAPTPPSPHLYGLRNRVVKADVPVSRSGAALCLDLSGVDAGLFPRVTLTLDGPPDCDPGLYPQNGTLILTPDAARPARGNRAAADGPGGDAVSLDAEGVARAPLPEVGADGTLSGWHAPDVRVEWRLAFPEGGVYAAHCVTRRRFHGRPWVGGRRVALAWNGRIVEKELAPDRRLDSRYYATAETWLGNLVATPGETGFLSLATLALATPEEEGMDLVEVRLVKTAPAAISPKADGAKRSGHVAVG